MKTQSNTHPGIFGWIIAAVILTLTALPASGQESSNGQEDGGAPQILTSDLSQRQSVDSEEMEVNFVFAGNSKITRITINGQDQKFVKSDTVAITTTIATPKGNTLVDVEVVDEQSRFRKKSYFIFYGGGSIGVWRAKWGSALGGALLFALYANQKSGEVKTSNSKQKELVAQINATTNQGDFGSLKASLSAEQTKAAKAASDANNAVLLTLGLTALAAWIYMDEPIPETDEVKELQVPMVLPDRGGFALVYQTKW
ncbi:MAG: hypothetical protein OEW12_02955 [Deltaproteobacteria bacterium]|nr:hypothetical protein [Deltaproteobacteria bacterium]